MKEKKVPPKTPTPFKPLNTKRLSAPRRHSKLEDAPSLLGREGKRK